MIAYNANNQIDYTTLTKDDPLCLCVRTYVQIMRATICEMTNIRTLEYKYATVIINYLINE